MSPGRESMSISLCMILIIAHDLELRLLNGPHLLPGGRQKSRLFVITTHWSIGLH